MSAVALFEVDAVVSFRYAQQGEAVLGRVVASRCDERGEEPRWWYAVEPLEMTAGRVIWLEAAALTLASLVE